MSNSPEQYTEWVINNILVNRGWHIDGINKNVFLQKPATDEHCQKLGGKRPDYILYKTGTTEPIAIIEAKKSGADLKDAIEQGVRYAEALGCKIVFAANGSYCETRFVPNGKELIINHNEVQEFITEKQILLFMDSNSICTIPEEILLSREELIRIFKNLNNILRGEGLRAGIERFSEFANILFLKLISENGAKDWWGSIKKQDNDDLIGYINDRVIKQVEGFYGGDVFTPLSIHNPKTLRTIIEKLDPLALSSVDSDIKGDCFEYFLEKTTSTDNDLGEYFTPRHIVKSIINLVDPKFKERVYDPFCGTGGFLTSAFQYIKENNVIEGVEDLKRLKEDTLFGSEITTTARIAKMNMILHGDGHSGVEKKDTLANPIDGKYDIVITNMPFSQKTEYGWLYENGLAKKNGDATCILHCLRSLKEGGRMALVVPEGVLFRKDLANLRKFLLSKCKLQAVISLPQGAFLPYTGVKTDILYFTDAHRPNNQKEYWYFDAKNIGYTLDNHRRKISGRNDLSKIAESDFRRVDKDQDVKQNMLDAGFEIVPMEKVKASDYNLVGTRYREILRHGGKWDMVRLSSVLGTIETGSRPSGGITGFETGAISLGGEQIGLDGDLALAKIPFVSIEFYNNAKKGFVQENDILICKDGALTGKVCVANLKLLPKKEVLINEHVYILRGNSTVINQSYLFHCIYSEEVQNQIRNLAYNKSAQPGLNRNHLDLIQIPLPSLQEQQRLAEELDKIQSFTKSAENAITSLKSQWSGSSSLTDSEDYEVVRLGDVCNITSGNSAPQNAESFENGIYSFFRVSDIAKDHHNVNLMDSVDKLNAQGAAKLKLFKKDSILFPKSGASCLLNHRAIMGCDGYVVSHLAVIESQPSRLLSKYLYHLLCNIDAKTLVLNDGYPSVRTEDIGNIQIPLPPLEIQQEIIKEIDEQLEYIKQTEQMIKKQQLKTKEILNQIWQTK